MKKTDISLKPKKILIFSLAYYPKHIGGAEVALKEITDRISSREIEFHMITNRFDSTLPEIEKIGNILVHRIGITTENPTMTDLKKFPLHLNKVLFQFLALYKARKLHRKYRYDGVWAMTAHSTGVPAAIFKILNPKVPYLLTLQEGDSTHYIKKKMRPLYLLFKRAFTSADKVQATSTFLGTWALDMGFKGDPNIIPNAVDIGRFTEKYPAKAQNELKKKLGKKRGDVFLITTSRLVKKNAVDDVIKSLKYLPDNIYFLILGTGPDEDALKQLAENEEVKERVKFLGHIDHGELPHYLKVSDIFIRPSLSEGMGNSFVEAMATGLPVIATQVGGIADFLFDPERDNDKPPTGRAVLVHDAMGVAQQVKAYLSDEEMTKSIVKNAKKLVIKKYDWDIIARDMKEKVFNPLVGIS